MGKKTLRRKTARPARKATAPQKPQRMIPGEVLLRAEPVEINAGREEIELEVANTGDRPVQVGSHFHFFEVNGALQFDRQRAWGRRLAIAAGTAIRFEPGQRKKVRLIEVAGRREIWGFNALVNGPLSR